MKASFVEFPAFERRRASLLSDEEFMRLQATLMANPQAGDVIPEAAGCRKLRFADRTRARGTRGGLRIIYYWWRPGFEFWLTGIYAKAERADLTADQRAAMGRAVEAEIQARRIQ